MERTERLEARITGETKLLLREAALRRGRSLSEFVVSAAIEKAEEILEHERVWRLNAQRSAQFVKALLSDSEPGERLRKAAERYKDSDLAK